MTVGHATMSMNVKKKLTTAVCMPTVKTALDLTIAHAMKDLKETAGHARMSMNASEASTTAVCTLTV